MDGLRLFDRRLNIGAFVPKWNDYMLDSWCMNLFLIYDFTKLVWHLVGSFHGNSI